MKILVIYATAGAGHRKAAEAIYEQCQNIEGHSCQLVDALDYTHSFYKFSYSKSYSLCVTKYSWLWGALFWFFDLPLMSFVGRILRRVVNTFNGQKLQKFLIQENFDYIFSTHFFSNEVAGYLKRSGKINSKIVCAVTDYDVHRFWVIPGIDYYAVAVDYTKNKLIKLGVYEEQIKVTGIPVSGRFVVSSDKRALRQKFGLKEEAFTVLIATGSFGIGPIEEILDSLEQIQVVVICGHNRKLFERLASQKRKGQKICGLVDNMHEWMTVSDVMVTKPGGLSISEALVVGLPMIFFNAIPGQETNNIRVLAQSGVGLQGDQVPDIVQGLLKYKSDAEALRLAHEATQALGKPAAAQEILAIMQ